MLQPVARSSDPAISGSVSRKQVRENRDIAQVHRYGESHAIGFHHKKWHFMETSSKVMNPSKRYRKFRFKNTIKFQKKTKESHKSRWLKDLRIYKC